MSSGGGWALGFAHDLEIPGWFHVPRAASPAERAEWVAQCSQALSGVVGSPRWDGEPATPADVEELLQIALEVRGTVDSDVIYQVWPGDFLGAVLCHVNLVTSASLPSWSEIGAIVYPVEAPHIGPGIQCSVTGSEDGSVEDLVSVHLVFDNGDVALMLSLEEAIAPLIASAMPGFMLLMAALRVEGADGTQFVSVAPSVPHEEDPWPFEEVG